MKKVGFHHFQLNKSLKATLNWKRHQKPYLKCDYISPNNRQNFLSQLVCHSRWLSVQRSYLDSKFISRPCDMHGYCKVFIKIIQTNVINDCGKLIHWVNGWNFIYLLLQYLIHWPEESNEYRLKKKKLALLYLKS